MVDRLPSLFRNAGRLRQETQKKAVDQHGDRLFMNSFWGSAVAIAPIADADRNGNRFRLFDCINCQRAQSGAKRDQCEIKKNRHNRAPVFSTQSLKFGVFWEQLQGYSFC